MSDERYLIVGATEGARDLLEQFYEKTDVPVVWAGSGLDAEVARELGATPVDVEKPSNPSTVQELIEAHAPTLVFLAPGGDRDLNELLEGDTLEQFLFENTERIAEVPVVILSAEHHG